ncbi:Short-chain dehydrogenase/reductase SDR [Neofusicoccum parvum]|nr:Short-chain dehydrogenase/reductase SDR [Neofusicoccum parvum]
MTSHPDWGVRTKATDAATAFSNEIKGRYVLITGVSRNSLGEASALAIAAHDPALLILASRTQSKVDEVADEIQSIRPTTPVKTVLLDLLSQDSVRRAAAEISTAVPRLDVLINNAGMVTQTRHLSPEGVEAQFATNHLGPFLLTNLLAPKLLAAASADGDGGPGATRVVNVSSMGLRLSPVRFHDYNLEGLEVPAEERGPPDDALPPAFTADVDGYRGFAAYGQSKTANVLFAVGLTARLRAKGVVAYGLHPGSIWTNLSRDLNKDGYAAIEGTATDWKSPDEGASTIVVAAFDPALNEPAGSFLSDCQYYEPPSYATDAEIAERLWALSEELVRESFEYSPKL